MEEVTHEVKYRCRHCKRHESWKDIQWYKRYDRQWPLCRGCYGRLVEGKEATNEPV